MEAALGVWAVLKRLPWKYIGIAVAAVSIALLLWRAPWAEARGRAAEVAKYQPVMKRASDRMALATRALDDAGRTINLLSSTNRAFAGKMAAALATSAKLRAAADKRDAARLSDIAKLQTAAGRPVAGPACDSLSEVKDSWK